MDKVEEAKSRLSEILIKAEKNGCQISDLARMSSVKKLIKESVTFNKYPRWIGLIGFPLIFLFLLNVSIHQTLVSLYLKWNFGNVAEPLVSYFHYIVRIT